MQFDVFAILKRGCLFFAREEIQIANLILGYNARQPWMGRISDAVKADEQESAASLPRRFPQ